MRVEFNDPNEFLAEVQKGGAVEPVLRVTKSFEQSNVSPNFRHVSVLATHLVQRGGVIQILQLIKYVGKYWGKEFAESGKTMSRADELLDKLGAAGKGLGLDVRAGVYRGECPPKTEPGDPPVI